MLLLAIATFLCLFSLLESLAGHFNARGKLDENSVVFVIFTYLTLDGSILAATAFVLRWNRLTWQNAFGFTRWTLRRSLGWGAFAALVFLPVGWVLNWLSLYVLSLLNRETPVQEAVQLLQNTHNHTSLAVQIVFAVAIAPVAEEVLFRGILYPAIKRLGFPCIALWGTSVLFAAIHANLPIFLPLVALAVALAMLYEYTDNLLAPITAHAIFNSVNLLGFFYDRSMTHGTQGCFPHWFS